MEVILSPIKNAIALFLNIFTVGCFASETRTSDLKIDSGIYITAENENTVPGVVEIGGCTATVVSTTTLITAAHCLDGKPVCIYSGKEALGECSENVYAPTAHNWDGESIPHDVAVVIFKNAPFKSFFEFARTAGPSVGDELHFVGYSEHNVSPEDAAKVSKRWGTNTVISTAGDQRYTILTKYGGTFSSIGISPGDSGGPAFQQCKLVGVASRMVEGFSTRTDNYGTPEKAGMHTNLLADPINRQFLDSTQLKGAYFCGYSGNDQNYCPTSGLLSLNSDPGEEFPCSKQKSFSTSTDNVAKILLEPSSSSTSRIYLSVPNQSDRIQLCFNNNSNPCEDGSEELSFVRHEGNRNIYVTKNAHNLSQIQQLSVIGFSNNNFSFRTKKSLRQK